MKHVHSTIGRARQTALLGIALVAAGTIGGCVYRTEKTVPASSPATTVVVTPGQRTVTYPQGRYELYGDGTTTPYYWVWIPAGTTSLPTPPPPPRVP
jgi:hypothetical protein